MWKTSEWKCHHENRDQTEEKQWKFREMKKKVRKKLNALGMVVGGRVRESGHLMLVSTIFVQVHFARVIISTFLCENARVIFFSLVPLSSVHECMNMFCFRHFWAVETLPANTLWNKAELKKNRTSLLFIHFGVMDDVMVVIAWYVPCTILAFWKRLVCGLKYFWYLYLLLLH